MPDYIPSPDEDPVEFDPVKAKAKRAQDAEKIRQDFIKSKSLRLPHGLVAPPQPQPAPPEDER